MRTPLLGVAAALICGAAAAHVTLEHPTAPAGASYKASFRVSHGCGTSPTRQLSVQVPASMRHAKPMPKPGWALELQRSGEQLVRVTWTARSPADALPPEHYDEFVVVAQAPAQAGAVYWPVEQVCEQGRADWTQVPAPGQKLHDLKSPAAYLEILPAGPAAGHQH